MQVNVVSEKNICFSDTALFNEQIFQAPWAWIAKPRIQGAKQTAVFRLTLVANHWGRIDGNTVCSRENPRTDATVLPTEGCLQDV